MTSSKTKQVNLMNHNSTSGSMSHANSTWCKGKEETEK
jgi:hypothetical protein